MATESAPPPSPDPEAVERQRQVVIAGHTGDAAFVDEHRSDSSPIVRAAALGAWFRLGNCTAADVAGGFVDVDPRVRARAAELAAEVPDIDPSLLLGDDDPSVVEVACFACGENDWPPGQAPVTRLAEVATGHDDPLCRESAAAALGAIGDPAGLDAVLIACTDRTTVRRRATLALAAFDDPRADAALHAALQDKDWQVRQAAEDLLGVGRNFTDPDPDAN